MEKILIVIPFIVGVVFILAGLKTIITRETTLIIQLWQWGNNDIPRNGGGGYSESTQTGFVAVLIGIVEILSGLAILFRHHL